MFTQFRIGKCLNSDVISLCNQKLLTDKQTKRDTLVNNKLTSKVYINSSLTSNCRYQLNRKSSDFIKNQLNYLLFYICYCLKGKYKT